MFERASADQQRELLRIFDRLEDDPYADGVRKFYYTRLLPAVMNIYIDEDYTVVYQLVSHDLVGGWQEWDIEVYNIALEGTGDAEDPQQER